MFLQRQQVEEVEKILSVISNFIKDPPSGPVIVYYKDFNAMIFSLISNLKIQYNMSSSV